jgi:alkanesulfonate monooxygenase SsuD/methylene tetrahydromethanopterin reductase-like flavin-dependent oxidoreductase (luciferase family)
VPFRALIEQRLKALELPDLHVMLLPHPMITRTVEEIEELADQFLDKVVQALTGKPLASGEPRTKDEFPTKDELSTKDSMP